MDDGDLRRWANCSRTPLQSNQALAARCSASPRPRCAACALTEAGVMGAPSRCSRRASGFHRHRDRRITLDAERTAHSHGLDRRGPQ